MSDQPPRSQCDDLFSISGEVGWTPSDIFTSSDSRCDHLDNSEVEELFNARVAYACGNADTMRAFATIRGECVNRHVDILRALQITDDVTCRTRLLNIMHANWYYAEILAQWIVSIKEQCAQDISIDIIKLRTIVDCIYESYARIMNSCISYPIPVMLSEYYVHPRLQRDIYREIDSITDSMYLLSMR